jgi:DNA-binding response OmpR family regulator
MPAAPETNKTILIVEDDAIFREGLAIILRREGYRVLLAENGREAIDRFHEGPAPNLLLLDMMLPVEDGWRLMERRRHNAVLAAVPVLIVTALGVSSPDWAKGLGACGLLRKPIEIGELLAEVQRCCR